MGWFAPEQSYFDYQHLYGIIMHWTCDCPVPTLKKEPHLDSH